MQFIAEMLYCVSVLFCVFHLVRCCREFDNNQQTFSKANKENIEANERLTEGENGFNMSILSILLVFAPFFNIFYGIRFRNMYMNSRRSKDK